MKIVFWIGGSFESWGPRSLETGIGGSEVAAARMAEHLTRQGHEVAVWGKVKDESVTYGGRPVCYLAAGPGTHREGARVALDCDVLVSSRDLAALSHLEWADHKPLSVLWVHDVHVGDDWQGVLSSYDLVFCLSRWARSAFMHYYPDVPAEKLVVTRNGIEPSLFLREGETVDDLGPVEGVPGRPLYKRPHRCIYSSSYDRGLVRLLDLWPRIKQKVPDADLGVYYGTKSARAAAALYPGPRSRDMLLQLDYLEHRMAKMEPDGVHYLGRCGQSALAQAFLESGLWLYPTSFCETSCISALEAQTAGCYPITSSIGALPETVRRGVIIAHPEYAGYDDAFVDAVAGAVGPRAAEVAGDVAQNRREVLAECSWAGVAAEWIRMFEERISARP